DQPSLRSARGSHGTRSTDSCLAHLQPLLAATAEHRISFSFLLLFLNRELDVAPVPTSTFRRDDLLQGSTNSGQLAGCLQARPSVACKVQIVPFCKCRMCVLAYLSGQLSMVKAVI